ncbi:MAG: TRAP transporter large permease [Spirochaetales bacterium]|nr:TRAP transporter large permease [Spirochaetales bacterium]
MSAELIGILGIVVLLVLLFMRVWIGFGMAAVGLVGYYILEGWNKAAVMVGTEPYSQISDLTLATIPLFVLMGAVISNTNLGKDLFETASKWIGAVKGGLASATVLACAAFAAVCGHTSATSITMGKIAMPQMKRYNYDEKLAAGVCTAGGTIGIMIPPSIAFILYGLITQVSIGKLFLAGFIPGLLQAIFYILTITIVTRIKPDWGPATTQKYTMREKVSSLKLSGPVLLIFIIAIGGIYLGVFTPTEAGAGGAFAAIVIALVARRLKWPQFKSTMLETTMTTAMMIALMAGAYIFQRFITVSNVPFLISDTIAALGLGKTQFMIVIVLFYLFLGCFMDIFGAIILTIPIIMPTVTALGINPVWFGVIVVRLMEIGLITPPLGMDVFTFSGAMDIPTSTVFKGIAPFVLTDFLHLALLIFIPQLSLLLIGG